MKSKNIKVKRIYEQVHHLNVFCYKAFAVFVSYPFENNNLRAIEK